MQWIAVVLLAIALPVLSACSNADSGTSEMHHGKKPAQVEHIEGTELSRVILSERASQRLGIETAPVIEVQTDRSGFPQTQAVIPYSSVLYDSHGHTWTYVTPSPLVFVRHPVEINFIEGERAYLSKGPDVGTLVAKVGAAELFGTEFEIGH